MAFYELQPLFHPCPLNDMAEAGIEGCFNRKSRGRKSISHAVKVLRRYGSIAPAMDGEDRHFDDIWTLQAFRIDQHAGISNYTRTGVFAAGRCVHGHHGALGKTGDKKVFIRQVQLL